MIVDEQARKDISRCLNETTVDNAVVYDRDAGSFISFPDRRSIPASMAGDGRYCVIDREMASSETLRPFRFKDRSVDGNVAVMTFTVPVSNLNPGSVNGCLMVPRHSGVQAAAEDCISKQVENLLTDGRRWTGLISSVTASSSYSKNGGSLIVSVTVTANGALSGASLDDFLDSFNMFPHVAAPAPVGRAVNCSWPTFVANVGGRIDAGQIAAGAKFSTTIAGIRYNVTF